MHDASAREDPAPTGADATATAAAANPGTRGTATRAVPHDATKAVGGGTTSAVSGADAVRAASARHEPLIQVNSFGERLGIVAMLILLLGALLPWGPDSIASWGPFALSALDLVPLTLGFLALMQVAAAATKTGDMVMLGLAGAGSIFAAALEATSHLATAQVNGLGLPITLLGAGLGFVAMEVLRREAGQDYARMAQRALELVLQPRVQLIILKLAIPFAIAGGFVVGALVLFGADTAAKLGAVFALYFINPAGKEVAIPVAITPMGRAPFGVPSLGLDPALVWAFIVLIDLCTALFLVWNFDHALRVPFLGRLLAWTERRGHAAVLRYKWIGRLAFFGLVVYAMLPLEGTGAIGGSVAGRAIGLTAWRTFIAVVCGSIIRTSLTLAVVLFGLHVAGIS